MDSFRGFVPSPMGQKNICMYCSNPIPVTLAPTGCDCQTAKKLGFSFPYPSSFPLGGPWIQPELQRSDYCHHAILQHFHQDLQQQQQSRQRSAQRKQCTPVQTPEGAGCEKSNVDFPQTPLPHLPSFRENVPPQQTLVDGDTLCFEGRSPLKKVSEAARRISAITPSTDEGLPSVAVNRSSLFPDSPEVETRPRPVVSSTIRKRKKKIHARDTNVCISPRLEQEISTSNSPCAADMKLLPFKMPKFRHLSPTIVRSILSPLRGIAGASPVENRLPGNEDRGRKPEDCVAVLLSKKDRVDEREGEIVAGDVFEAGIEAARCSAERQKCVNAKPLQTGNENSQMAEIGAECSERSDPMDTATDGNKFCDKYLWVLWDDGSENAPSRDRQWYRAVCSLSVMNAPSSHNNAELLPFLPAVQWTLSAAQLRKAGACNPSLEDCCVPVTLTYTETKEEEYAKAAVEKGRIVKLCSNDGMEIEFSDAKEPPQETSPRQIEHESSIDDGARKVAPQTVMNGAETNLHCTRIHQQQLQDAASGVPPYTNPPRSVEEEAEKIARELLAREDVSRSDLMTVLYRFTGDARTIRRLMEAELCPLGLVVAKSTIPGGGEGLFVSPGSSFKKGSFLLTYWGHLHFGAVREDIAAKQVDLTFIGKPEYGVTARWFYTRGAQAGEESKTKSPIYLIPHPACAATKINDPRLAPGELKTTPRRTPNVQMMWCEDEPLGSTKRVAIVATCDIEERDYPQELFLWYGAQYDFEI